MKRVFIPVTMAVAVAAAPLHAQTPPGTFGRSSELITQADLSRQMARCAVKLNREGARNFVLAVGANSPERQRARAFRQSLVTCLSGARSATLDPVAIEGAIAETLLLETEGALLVKAAAVPAVAPARVVVAADVSLSHQVIDCAVKARPNVAVQMLRAAPESVEELNHFQALGASLQACVPQDAKLSIKPFHVRALVAGALYRRVTSAVAADPSTGRNDAQG